MDEVINTWRERLPSHGFGTDDLRTGLRFLPVENLLTLALVQHNMKHSLGSLVFDLDSETSLIDLEDRECPPPNIVAINPDNGHSHVFYMLEAPVHNYDGASKKALRWMAAIDLALTKKLGADPGYSKLISKNPINERWITFFPRVDLYDLQELADWVDPEILKHYNDLRRKLPGVGFGRNCRMFEDLRFWAYRERRKEQLYLSQGMFYEACLWRGLAINKDFTPPLPHSEVRSTARSVAKWTWRNMSYQGFREWAKRRSLAAARERTAKSLELRQQILEAKEQCPDLNQSDLAVLIGVSRQTINKHLRQAQEDIQ